MKQYNNYLCDMSKFTCVGILSLQLSRVYFNIVLSTACLFAYFCVISSQLSIISLLQLDIACIHLLLL